MREHAIHQGPGDFEPLLLERRLIECKEAISQMGVVLEHAAARRPGRPSTTGRANRPAGAGRRRSCRLPVPRRPGSRRPASGSVAARRRAASAKAAIASPFQAASALSSRAGCGRSPRRARSSARASASRAATSVADDPERHGKVRVVHDPRQDRHALPVALLGHAVRRREEVGRVAQHLPDLGGTPGERQAFDAVGVGVLARGEGAVVGRELAEHVVERPGRDREQVRASPVSAHACR